MIQRLHIDPYTRFALGFFLLELMILVRNALTGYWTFYWYCDFAPLFFGIFFLLRQYAAAKGLMYIGILGQITYLISFATTAFFNVPFLGFIIPPTYTLFESIVTVIIHTSACIAFAATARVSPTPRSLTYSAAFLAGIYTAVRLTTEYATSVDYNFNYIYSTDILAAFPHLAPYYTALWIPIVFTVIVLPTYGIDNLIFFLYHQTPHLPHTPTRLVPQSAS